MSVKGSRLAPNLLFRRRAPRATPRTSPDFSVMHRTILSASASWNVCRTMACVSTKPIALFESPRGGTLPGHEVEQPGQREADADEFEENLQAVAQAAALALTADDTEDQRDEEREENHQRKVYQAFLPALMSNASSASMRLSSPATIRKTLPYSEVACSGRSLTASPAKVERR